MKETQNYASLSDEMVIAIIREGNQEAVEYLLHKYTALVKKETRKIYMIGADYDDVAQEGMIGLFQAIRDYDETKGASFHTFASLCIKRHICSIVTASNRMKHKPLNEYVSFYTAAANASETGDEWLLLDMLTADLTSNPEEVVIDQENVTTLEQRIQSYLSTYEQRVLELYLQGKSYTDIASQLDKSEKSVDNAIQRIRSKINAENE